MTAILLDKNRVFPKWFGYFNLCNALTEVVVALIWLDNRGSIFSWNGVITWWLQVFVFAIYTAVFITLLWKMIRREDFGTGPLPELAIAEAPGRSGSMEAAR
jgi:membrane protein implicated in regulation of membrane protease activity